MPYTAYHPQSEDIHFAAKADAESEYVCIDCPEPVQYVRNHERDTSNGVTRVSAHFRYTNCPHGTVTEVSNGTGGGGGGGETDIHKRRKRAALQEALQRFPAADYGTEVKIGPKRADALLKFEDPHEEYGKGLVIEYQHKNEGKDIEATQEHFANHEYTTIWLWEDQFTFTSSIPDIDLFGGEVYTPWPDAVPQQSDWTGEGLHHEKRRKWREAYSMGLTDCVVEANILKHWVVESTADYWERKDWEARFQDYAIYPFKRDLYRVRQSLDSPGGQRIDLPREWYDNRAKEIWRNQAWDDLFPGDNSKHMAQAAVPRAPATTNQRALFPPEVADEASYRAWQSNPHVDSHRRQIPASTTSVEIDPPIHQFLPRSFWRDAWEDGKDEHYNHERPYGPFDDVQCHVCGNYIYAKNAPDACQNCGAKYDWEWNLRTGRVSMESVPDGALD